MLTFKSMLQQDQDTASWVKEQVVILDYLEIQ
jgi:hypothetical protein